MDERIDKLIEKHTKKPPGLTQHLRGIALASPLGKVVWPKEHAMFIQIVRRLKDTRPSEGVPA